VSIEQVQFESEDQLRERYRKMSDEKLREMGEAARYMCSPKANMKKPPRQCFVDQLRIAREVWRERHPKKDVPTPTEK
jgi:hypothetical protein